MKNAIIGYTGFVGGNLLQQHDFQDQYRSTNIHEIRGKQYDTLVCSGAPAAKWIANKEPEEDKRNIQSLMDNLLHTVAKQVILISTVDVYPEPTNVNELTDIDFNKAGHYGKHRYELELFIKEHFPNVLILRLPGLFGPGLKKNAIYDFIHNNHLELINSKSVFQFYNIQNLWKDIMQAQNANLSLLNISTEPVSIKEVAQHCFSMDFHNQPSDSHAIYDVKSCYDDIFRGRSGYLYSKQLILDELKQFVEREARSQP